MKRSLLLSVSAAALFIGAPAMADDSTSTVTQGGATNNAQVTQTAAARSKSLVEQNVAAGTGNNTAKVTQGGPATTAGTDFANDSSVKQMGQRDSADVEQTSLAGLPAGYKNISTISQTGTGTNDATKNAAVVKQFGHNKSGITQTGASNSATVRQGRATDLPVGGNDSSISQNGDDKATVDQNSAPPTTGIANNNNYGGNTSIITQTGGKNEAGVTQTGLYATSTILQSSVNTAKATVTQNGDQQDSYIDQGGDANEATVTQSDVSGESDVLQYGKNGRATVTQSGTDQKSVVNQASTSSYASATVVQGGGHDNDSNVSQKGTYEKAGVTQTGSQNKSIVEQNAVGTSAAMVEATVKQLGDSNYSKITQAGSPTFARVTQNGNENDSTVGQSGTGGKVTVTQTQVGNAFGTRYRFNDGTDGTATSTGADAVRANFSKVSQAGSKNEVKVEQSGELNRSNAEQTGTATEASIDVKQSGIFNNSSVKQTAKATAIVDQKGAYGDNNSMITQDATGNYAKVTQIGTSTEPTYFPSNSSSIMQTASSANARAEVEQTGQQNTSVITQSGANTSHPWGAGVSAAQSPTVIVKQSNVNGPYGAGDVNMSTVNQTALSSAYVEQIGYGHTSDVQQLTYSTDPNADGRQYAVTVKQSGHDNTSKVTHTAAGRENTTFVMQSGSDNLSEVTQSGSEGYVSVIQSDVGNKSYVTQGGSGNQAYVTQSTANNYSMITQGGSNNIATVTQGAALPTSTTTAQ